MQTGSPGYFLFPHMILTEGDFRNFSIFLPNCNILEIIRPARIPEWLVDRFHGRPAIADKDFPARIDATIRGYRAFAEVHGGRGGVLAFLSRAEGGTIETRVRIQEELRGKGPSQPDEKHGKILQAAVFLEIARELDEKEMELEGNFVELNALEGEFRGILGITGDEEADEAEASLSPPLIPDRAGSLFMLPERIRSWFQLFFVRPVEGTPVFVALHPEIIAETLEILRAECAGGGAEFTTVRISLGSFPRLDRLGSKQFRSLMESPGTPDLLDAYRRGLDEFMTEAARAKNLGDLESRSEHLKGHLEKFCRHCDLSGADRVNLSLYFPQNTSPAGIPETSSPAAGQAICRLYSDNLPLFLCIDRE